jgi:hypothetical protein
LNQLKLLSVEFVPKDSKGKIKIHDIICPNLGNVGIFDCHCPLRRASSTVQTTLGQLKRIFESYGKGSRWDGAMLLEYLDKNKGGFFLQYEVFSIKLSKTCSLSSHIKSNKSAGSSFGSLKLQPQD